MGHLYKTFEIKADEAGTISGFFSTYDREPDSYGDIIEPGAFTETIKARKESGHPFPLCWGHDLNQIIGSVEPDDIKDTEKGPLMTASFFDTPRAQEVREIVKSGVVYQFSFAYDVTGWREPTAEEKQMGIVNVLTAVNLFEISIVPIPANQNAVMTEIKSNEPEAKSEEPEIKAGRRNSAKDADIINQIINLAKSLLDSEEEEPEVNGEDEPEVNAAAEEQTASNPEKERLLELIKSHEMEGKDEPEE